MVEITHNEQGLMVFSGAGIFGSIWFAQPTVEMIRVVHQARLAQEVNHPGEFVMLTMIKIPKLRSLSAEARESTKETRKGLEVYCRADASIVETEAGPLGETMVRMAFAAINLMNRSIMPNKLFTNRTEGIRWLTSFTTLSSDEMTTIVEEVLSKRQQ